MSEGGVICGEGSAVPIDNKEAKEDNREIGWDNRERELLKDRVEWGDEEGVEGDVGVGLQKEDITSISDINSLKIMISI